MFFIYWADAFIYILKFVRLVTRHIHLGQYILNKVHSIKFVASTFSRAVALLVREWKVPMRERQAAPREENAQFLIKFMKLLIH